MENKTLMFIIIALIVISIPYNNFILCFFPNAPEINVSIKINYYTTHPQIDMDLSGTMKKISCFGFITEKYNIIFYQNETGDYWSQPINFTLNNYDDEIYITYWKEPSGGGGRTLTYDMLESYNGKIYILEVGRPPSMSNN